MTDKFQTHINFCPHCGLEFEPHDREILEPLMFRCPGCWNLRQELLWMPVGVDVGAIALRCRIPYNGETPKRLWTLFLHQDEKTPPELPYNAQHHVNAFLEDKVHDYNIDSGILRYSSRAMSGGCWLLLEFPNDKKVTPRNEYTKILTALRRASEDPNCCMEYYVRKNEHGVFQVCSCAIDLSIPEAPGIQEMCNRADFVCCAHSEEGRKWFLEHDALLTKAWRSHLRRLFGLSEKADE